MLTSLRAALASLLLVTAAAHTQEAATKPPLAFEERHVALVGVDLYDGTGAPVQKDMIVVVRDGRIAGVGPAASTAAPAGARTIHAKGQALTPGFVLMHEHLFYPLGFSDRGFSFNNYASVFESFVALYLAGGATTIRTAGSVAPYADLNVSAAIRAGTVPGPDIDVSAPYIDGPRATFMQARPAATPSDIERAVEFWSTEGATSYKAYMWILPAQLEALVRTAHRRGAKVTGHVCATTYEEAVLAGIDNLEHGFVAATDFVPDRKPGQCPEFGAVVRAHRELKPDDARLMRLVKLLVEKKVALTSTPAVLEWTGAMLGRGGAPLGGLELLAPDLRARLQAQLLEGAAASSALERQQAFVAHELALERVFFDAGGTLMVGTDPTGGGQALPGHAGLRSLWLLAKAGFRVEDVVKIATLNAARYLGREAEIGSIAPGKRADLVLFRRGLEGGDGFTMERVAWVMKAGVAYDSTKLLEPWRG